MRLLLSLALILHLSFIGISQQPAGSSDQNRRLPETANQQPARPAEDDVVRITTNLVQVDAVITDRKGKPVTDLVPDEVEILENGKAQKITHFSLVSVTPPEKGSERSSTPDKNVPPIPPVTLRPEQVKRTIALVVDDLGLSFDSAHFVRQALKKFVNEQVQPGDLIAIIRTAGGVGALQQFTSDKRQLLAAAERVKWNPTGRGGIGAFAPIGGSAGNEETEDLDEFRQEIFAVGTLGALNYVIRGMKELPGRKSLLLFSDGLRIFNRADPLASGRLLSALRILTDRANRASVVIYSMDARGLVTFGFTAADSVSANPEIIEQQLLARRNYFFESQDGLNYLAQRTGGFFIRNTNDPGDGIRRVLEDQKSYYLIGYRPDESTFELASGRRKFNKLGLKVLRPGKFNVRIRNGFYGVSDEEVRPSVGTPRQRLYDALMSPFGSAEVHLRLTSLFLNVQESGSLLRSMLHVQARDLTFKEEAGSHEATFDVVIMAFGDNGVLVDQVARTHTIRLSTRDHERALRQGFVYNVEMPIKKAGAYQLRSALRDRNSERVGSASQFVEVPDIKKNKLTLSGILVRGMSLATYKKFLTNNPQAGNSDGTVEESVPGASPALREFRRGMAMVYGLDVYNSRLDKVTGKPSLQFHSRLFRNGQQLFAGKETAVNDDQKDPKRLTIFGAIQLGTELEPGEYVFQVVVTDLLAKEKSRIATQWIGFEIVE